MGLDTMPLCSLTMLSPLLYVLMNRCCVVLSQQALGQPMYHADQRLHVSLASWRTTPTSILPAGLVDVLQRLTDSAALTPLPVCEVHVVAGWRQRRVIRLGQR